MSKPAVRRWNVDKPHRCPKCHAIPEQDGKTDRSSWRVYRCCTCGTLFTRWPKIAWFLKIVDCTYCSKTDKGEGK